MSEQPTKECPTCQGTGTYTYPATLSTGDYPVPQLGIKDCHTCSGTGRIAVATKVLLPQPAEPSQAEQAEIDKLHDTSGHDFTCSWCGISLKDATPEPSKGKKIEPLASFPVGDGLIANPTLQNVVTKLNEVIARLNEERE